MSALADSLRLRLLSFFVLYVSQGLPLGLLGTVVPAWMAANGASAGDIAVVAAFAGVPWTCKFALAFVIDRYTFLPMGRRRVWIIGAQVCVLVALLAGAIISPSAADTSLLAALSFTINAFTSIHDVAVDALAVDIVEEADRPRVSAWMFGGQVLGNAVAAIAGGMILSDAGIGPALLAVAVWVVGAMILMANVRERAGERSLPWNPGEVHPVNVRTQASAWRNILASAGKALVAPASLLFLLVPAAHGYQTGIFIGAASLIATKDLGWNTADFGLLAGAITLVAALVGMVFGGRLGHRFGAARCLFAITLISIVLDLFAVSGVLDWTSQVALIGFATVWVVFANAMGLIFLIALAMSLCDRRAGATQCAIYMALSNLGGVAGSASLGLADVLGGPASLFYLTLVAHLLTAGSLILLLRLRLPARSPIDSLAA